MAFVDQEQLPPLEPPRQRADASSRVDTRRRRRRWTVVSGLLVGAALASGVLSQLERSTPPASRAPARAPIQREQRNVYAATASGSLSPAVRLLPERIYVPNSESNTVDVIDPVSLRIIARLPVGKLPQHVTPAYDLRTLWVDNDHSNTLTAIDPRTGRVTGTKTVIDPYNLYFSPGGREAIVVAEAMQRLDFRGARSMRLHQSLKVPCPGVDHLDFTADGHLLVASCEFANRLIEVDIERHRLVGTLNLPDGASPQDVKLSPDGRVFYVADKTVGGVYLIDAARFRTLRFVRTGAGAHGLFLSRDTNQLYVTNRGAGTVSVISLSKRRVLRTWRIPGGSPDMGGVSSDGKTLWLSGRYNAEIYALDTRTGRLRARIRVGQGPHGLSVFPQPGRFSLGHTGLYR